MNTPHSFTGLLGEGDAPNSGVILGSDGDLYGTTFYGGLYGNGSIYKVNTQTGLVQTVWSFGETATDPANPAGLLIESGNGTFYGTTYYGGIPSSSYGGSYGAGTIFRFDGTTVTTLYSFSGGVDGANPFAGLVRATDGRFYGTAAYSGINDNGTIFRCTVVGNTCATSNGLLDILYQFSGNSDGSNPFGGLLQGRDGSFYGTTNAGGIDPVDGSGTIFKCTLTSGGVCTTTNGLLAPMYTLTGGADGGTSYASLIQGTDSNLYGTTAYGGTNGNGTIFRITLAGAFTTLYRFTGGTDGSSPFAGLFQGADGSFYGTAIGGGSVLDDGIVFKCTVAGNLCATSAGQLPKLYTFVGLDGNGPFSSLIQLSDGTFYGTTQFGGLLGSGTVFRLTPKAVSTVAVTGGTFVYNGLIHPAIASASSSTNPSLAPVTFTYNGSPQAPSLAGTYAVVATFAGDTFNLASSATATITIIKASSTVTVNSQSFTYDGLPHAAVASATGGAAGVALPVTVTYKNLAGATVGAPTAAGTYTATAACAGDANNTASSASATVTINRAPLTITANPASRNAGAANPTFTATVAGFVHGETTAVLQGTLGYTTSANTTSPVGTYPITPGGVTAVNYTITFVPGVLTIVNAPPVAVNDSVSTPSGAAVSIQVLANDSHPSGPLTITAVTPPSHGSAVITGSAILYTPVSGFSGTDTFTYTVTDGIATSAASVAVAVGGIGRFVVMSTEFTWLRPGTIVTSGDIGANLQRQHHHGHGYDFDDGDGDDVTVRIGAFVSMLEPSSRVVGDTVALEPRASIYGVVDNYLINHGGTILGTRVNAMPTPFVTLPAFPSIAAGNRSVTVSKNKTSTLAPGSYGKVHVSSGATLTLTGGLYQFTSLDVDQSATVLFGAAAEIRIAGDLDADNNSRLIVASGMRASQVRIFVAGDDDHCDNRRDDSFDGDWGGDVAVNIGESSVVQANIYAPGGSVWLKSRVQATGAFIGQHVRIGVAARLTLDSAF